MALRFIVLMVFLAGCAEEFLEPCTNYLLSSKREKVFRMPETALPDGAGVPGQLRKAGVVALGLEFGPQGGVFLNRCGFSLVAFNPCSLGHKNAVGSVRVNGLRQRAYP